MKQDSNLVIPIMFIHVIIDCKFMFVQELSSKLAESERSHVEALLEMDERQSENVDLETHLTTLRNALNKVSFSCDSHISASHADFS